MAARAFSWKQNLAKVPPQLRAKFDQLRTVPMIVAAVKRIPVEEIARGGYAHVGLKFEAEELVAPPCVVPKPRVGKYSRRNVEGWEVVRKDLPKITKSYPHEAPNWHGSGTHTVYQSREVFQREYHEARDITIKVEPLEMSSSHASIKFSVDFVLDRQDAAFETDLLFCLNLLQENVGAVDIFGADTTREQFLRTLHVDWQIFPAGSAEHAFEQFTKRMTNLSAEGRRILKDRVEVFASLKPQQYIQGTGGLNRYIGAKFADDLVIFENVRYGNALYILYEDWNLVSQRSRIDLLHGTDAHFDRIVHGPEWKKHLRMIFGREFRKRGKR